MLEIRVVLAVLTALVLAVVGDGNQRLQARHVYGFDISTQSSSVSTPESTTNTLSVLERAHWCRFPNGTYVPLNSVFAYRACSICQCTRMRVIRCQPLQCMPTYCVDNTMPTRRNGQCCTQCAYEKTANACSYNNFTFPHGSIIKSDEDKMQCWCQLGNIECRNYMGSFFQGLDLWGSGSGVFVVAIVLLIVLIFGLLLCCACTAGCYYYYRRNEHTFQQAYEQYVNPAGWQPMDEEEENVIDPAEEEKRLEAEKSQFENGVGEVVPPPYAAYNGSYVSGEK